MAKLLSATPLQPFSIKMSDGNSYEVHHPETLAIGKHFMVLIEPEPIGLMIFICCMLCRLNGMPKIPA